ncbi:NADH-ubiquinone oxidoreductase chain J [Dissulfuribacter thermophilus]|uniref:NADH-quinone oxidoreductase subunit J n=1 Tax=Dissulfuribacter thermophilus TaxID=1156395 RepID=A0A1B9F3V8_9BACT|nr:NADH-quinone oxidoreductase subunit J [Dissulfuribacter thermophilus]OCC14616.1 NADH-ubiquinone oxidoreductase chain J [Dissulfuribacter thermophilus]
MDPYFLVFAIMALGAGVFTISARDALPSALGLLTVFIALSALYLHLHAPLIAIFQVTIYAGAILVLIVFVIMLLMSPGQTLRHLQKNLSYRIMGGILGASMIALLVIGLKGLSDMSRPRELPQGFGHPSQFGDLFFKDYLMHFEVASILLLVALIGAIYLAKRKA